MIGAPSRIRTDTVRLLKPLSPASWTTGALFANETNLILSRLFPYSIGVLIHAAAIDFPGFAHQATAPSVLRLSTLMVQAGLLDWCHRTDSNRHCSVSKTDVSYQLDYSGIYFGCGPLSRTGG